MPRRSGRRQDATGRSVQCFPNARRRADRWFSGSEGHFGADLGSPVPSFPLSPFPPFPPFPSFSPFPLSLKKNRRPFGPPAHWVAIPRFLERRTGMGEGGVAGAHPSPLFAARRDFRRRAAALLRLNRPFFNAPSHVVDASNSLAHKQRPIENTGRNRQRRRRQEQRAPSGPSGLCAWP